MWEENVPFDEDSISNETEREDFAHCKRRSDFKYLIYHVTGYTYNFTQESNMNYDNAVS